MKDEFLAEYKIIGVNIRRFRDKLNYSQDDLASRCSVNRAKISKIENAREDYMFSTLLEVCKALGKTLQEIIQKYEGFDYE